MTDKEKRYVELINNCMKRCTEFIEYYPIDYYDLRNNKFLIEICIECVSNIYLDEGLNSNDEPTKYGLELYHLIEYLNELSYLIENK